MTNDLSGMPIPTFDSVEEGFVRLAAVLHFYWDEKAESGTMQDTEASLGDFLLFVAARAVQESGLMLDEIEAEIKNIRSANQRARERRNK